MKILAILIAMTPLACATHAPAQDVGQFATPTSFVANNFVASEMGGCLLKHDRRQAIRIVDLDPASPAFRTLAKEIERPMIACLKGRRSASISSFYLRGAISEALLQENGSVMLRAAGQGAPVSPRRVTVSSEADPAPAVIGCAVKADPVDAAAMIAADAESAREMEAFSKLAPSLQACVPASGAVKLRRPTVRPGVAIALYRLGRGVAVSPSSNGAN